MTQDCQHIFCRACLERWLERSRSCPLCKQRVRAYIHSIAGDASYCEAELPPTRAACGDDADDGAAEDILARLQAFFEAAAQRGEVRLGSSDARGWVWQSPERLSGGGGGPRRHHRGGPVGRVPPSVQQQQQHRGSAGPRPYFLRMQRMLAGRWPGAVAGAAAPPTVRQRHPPLPLSAPVEQEAMAEEERALTWRRQVYEQCLWAVPSASAGTGSGGGGALTLLQAAASSSGAGSVAPGGAPRDRRLVEFVERELRALTGQGDVTILRVGGAGPGSGDGGRPSSMAMHERGAYCQLEPVTWTSVH